MNKQKIIDLLIKKYAISISYFDGLTIEEFVYRYQQKWTAGQQLAHLVLCIKPLLHVFSMDRSVIEQKFGSPKQSARTYETLVRLYKKKIGGGGKAPDRFVPEMIIPEQRTVLSETLTELIRDLCFKIDTFAEQELDSLCIPHPLLGNLSMREMLYNTIYHAEHHWELARQNLNQSGIK